MYHRQTLRMKVYYIKTGVIFLIIAMAFIAWIMNYQSQVDYNMNIVDYTTRYNLQIDVRPKYMLGRQYMTTRSQNMVEIPHIIHQTYKTEQLPLVVKPWMQSWLKKNPKWQYWYWTDEDIRLFISTRYPDFLTLFDSYNNPVQRSDVFRYFVLYEFGGLYVDTDVECLKSLDSKIVEHQCILTQESPMHAMFFYQMERILANSIIACRPRHPFMKFVMEQLRMHRKKKVLWATGPAFVETTYNDFIRFYSTPQSSFLADDIPYIAPFDEYHPKIDPRKIANFTAVCTSDLYNDYKPKREICEEILSPKFTNGPKNTSITVHHWTHSWAHDHSKYGIDQIKGTFHIKDLFSDETHFDERHI